MNVSYEIIFVSEPWHTFTELKVTELMKKDRILENDRTQGDILPAQPACTIGHSELQPQSVFPVNRCRPSVEFRRN